MDYASLRNFKDFMLLYNVTTETCFQRCVNNFNTRKLGEDEIKCVELCAGKYMNYLNRVMNSYIVAQQDIVMKRIADVQSQNDATMAAQDTSGAPVT